MGKVFSGLFGGGSKSNNDAKVEAEKSRQLQQVANDRQLAELNRNDNAVAATRRAPRGRRLFEEAPAATDAVLI